MISLFNPKSSPEEAQKSSGALQQLRQAFVVGGGMMGGGTVIFGAFELMRSEPDKAFRLLEIWGPWFILALFSVWAANGLLQQALRGAERIGDRVCDSFDAVAAEQKRLADSQDVIAAAAKQTAEKDDRERERMTTLVEYTGQQSRETAESVRAMQPVLVEMSRQLTQLSSAPQNSAPKGT